MGRKCINSSSRAGDECPNSVLRWRESELSLTLSFHSNRWDKAHLPCREPSALLRLLFQRRISPQNILQTHPEIMVNQISENSVAERAANLITKSNHYSRCFTQNKIIFHKCTSSAGAKYVWKSVG